MRGKLRGPTPYRTRGRLSPAKESRLSVSVTAGSFTHAPDFRGRSRSFSFHFGRRLSRGDPSSP